MSCYVQPSVFESARSADFSSLPLIVEDWIKDNGGTYSGEDFFVTIKPYFY